MGVVGERFHHVGAGVHEIAMELRDDLGVLEHDFRHIGARLQVAPALELEHVAFGADHRAFVEAVEKGGARRCR